MFHQVNIWFGFGTWKGVQPLTLWQWNIGENVAWNHHFLVDGGFLVPYFQTIPWDYVRPKVYQQGRLRWHPNVSGKSNWNPLDVGHFYDPSWWRTRIYPSWMIRRNSLPHHLNGEICGGGLTPSTGCIPSIKTTRSSTGSIQFWVKEWWT